MQYHDSLLIQVLLNRKWLVISRTVSVKAIVCQKLSGATVTVYTYNNVVIRCAKQSVKQQGSTVSPKAHIWIWKQKKLANSTWTLSFVWIQIKNGMSVSRSTITQWQAEILSPTEGNVYKWCWGTDFLHSENLRFARTYHHTFEILLISTNVFWYTTNYTFGYGCAKYVVIQTSGSEKMQVTNVDQVGRQHKTTMCDCESNELFVRRSYLWAYNLVS